MDVRIERISSTGEGETGFVALNHHGIELNGRKLKQGGM